MFTKILIFTKISIFCLNIDLLPKTVYLTPRGARRQLVAKSVFFALLGHTNLP